MESKEILCVRLVGQGLGAERWSPWPLARRVPELLQTRSDAQELNQPTVGHFPGLPAGPGNSTTPPRQAPTPREGPLTLLPLRVDTQAPDWPHVPVREAVDTGVVSKEEASV